ncbi:MAG: Maf family protein [Luminiphilus sp.]|jgi:septum formation protein|nr:Maf family protein [Luminiphilus sp.]
MRGYAVKANPRSKALKGARHVFSPKVGEEPLKPLTLSSTSPYRTALLRRLKVPFDTINPDVTEHTLPEENAADRAQRLARLKAEAPSISSGLVIGSDQVACLGEHVLHKPRSSENAIRQLMQCAGQTVTFLTAVHVISTDTEWTGNRLVASEVVFRRFTSAEAEQYVKLDAPLDCAGSFKWEALGISLFSAIRGDDPTALQGLPLIALCDLLREAGLPLPLHSEPMQGGF